MTPLLPPCRRRSVASAASSALAALAFLPARAAEAPPPAGVNTQRVEIIATTPVPGTGVPRDQLPANVQTADDRRLRQLQSLNLPDFLSTAVPSVNVNEIQGNPYQIDVNYRGFTASPLLGTPQGLSVFQDGVRINEPFGDVVNWDLVPKVALADITLLPGSNPLFGLNTLGGALSLQTKSGDTHPGTEVELEAGSFGRVSSEISHGRTLGETGHVFLAAATFDEDGWRDYSPSRIRQAFLKGGQHTPEFSWDLSLTHAENALIGNGPLPESLLAADRTQVYTRPDRTENTLNLLSLNARWKLNTRWELSGTAYSRHTRADTLNGDLNDDYDPPDVTEAGVENRTWTRQRGEGLALQATYTGGIHRLVAGVSLDQARSEFQQTEAEGSLDATRAVVVEDDPEVDAWIRGRSRTHSLYLSEMAELAPGLHLTASGRYNDTRVRTDDLGRARLGLDTTLDADATYRKFNPAIGMTWQAAPGLTAYGGFSQGNRAPSPIELGCSDPENACVLPNALQSDPPLKQVVSRTLEAGLRGTLEGGLRWNASAWRTVNQDDLLFISNGRAAGYFTNFGKTRRQGVELGMSQRRAAFDWAVSYTWLRATFETGACVVAEANSSAETSAACPGEGEIEIRPGNTLPGLPRHALKMTLDARPTDTWRVGAQLQAYSGQYVRGNENNAHRPDGEEFNGRGRIGGYAVLNLTTSWRFAPGWELFGKVNNVFDRRYASSGLLGENAFDSRGVLQAPDDWRNEQFVGPGAPRGVWVGLRWALGDS